MTGPLVLKLGGELLESATQRDRIAAFVSSLALARPVVVVHGGGRAVDAALDLRGIAPKKIDGLRITDAPTRDVVVSVLGGLSNTELVAACVSRGVLAVGLTGVDAGLGQAIRSSAHRTAAGDVVDLGLVGDPVETDTSLLELLLVNGYVPVVASLGLEAEQAASFEANDLTSADRLPTAQVLNINADVMACRIAAELGGADLVIAGATAGVFDAAGKTIPSLDLAAIDALIESGTATAGMIAKLSACRAALVDGVTTVRIVSGREFDGTRGLDAAPGTTLRADPTLGRSTGDHAATAANSDAHIGSDRE